MLWETGPRDTPEQNDRREKQRQQEQEMAPYLVGFVVLIVVLVISLLLWFHPHVEFHKAPKSKHDFTLQEVHEHLENHTLLHIGGLHRSAQLCWLISLHSIQALQGCNFKKVVMLVGRQKS